MVLNKWLSPASGTSRRCAGTEGIKARGEPRARLSFAPEMEMKSALPILLPLLLLLSLALICNQVDAAASSQSSENELEPSGGGGGGGARKHKHHLLLLLGGLKSVAAVVLIKIKIVLVVAAIVAVSMFTVKYLMGATALPDLPFLLHNKANLPQPPPLPPPPPPPPSHHYLPVEHEHEPVYAHGYSPPVTWDHGSHEHYGNEWSKIGGRSFASYLDLEKISSKNAFNVKRKKIRRRL